VKMEKLQYYSDAEQSARRNPDYFAKATFPVLYAGKKISLGGKILYFILSDYGRNGKINVSVERLAADMEVSTRQIRNLLGELENKNLIRRLPVFNKPNNILLLSLRPQGVATGDGDEPRQPDEPTTRPAEQRRRSAAPAHAATASTPTTATGSASRCSSDQSSASDRQPVQGGRDEKYFHAAAPDAARRQDEPSRPPEIFFQKGRKYFSPKREESKEINSTVCEAQSADISQNLPGKGKEGARDYQLNQQTNPKPEQKTEGNSENQKDNLGYVALRNFGIWEGKARRLAEIAARQHGDEADRYISNWIAETNRRKRVQDPCAYLSSAISDNWKLPATRKPSATGSRSSRPSGAHRQRPPVKPIDFSKYANNTPAADERRNQDADRSAAPGAIVAPPVYRETDFYLRLALKDYRPNTAYLLDYAELNGDSVKIRFLGGRQPVDFEPTEWLRMVKVYYPTINRVEVISSY
jgi:hypothetical protein